MKLSDEAKKLRNEYHREWRKKNSDKVKQAQKRYWERKAQELKEEHQEAK